MLVACKSSNCRPCGAADKTSDTVKVDMSSIHDMEKENNVPQQTSEQQLELERQQAAQAEIERNRQEQLRLQQLEEQRRVAEAAEQKRKQMQLQAEAEEKERQRAAEAKRAAEVAEMQRRQMEEAKREREAQEREEEARRAEKQRQDAEKVAAFLKAKGFSSVTASRRKMLKTSYPLHVAVADKDAEMVELLLEAGADPAQKNSSSATPEQQALKLNKNGSHDAVLAKLRRPE